ncbi:hypothetical protein PMIN06_000245 [Paraphaeosphaeria minitans]
MKLYLDVYQLTLSPSIASRFQQYQDTALAFVLETNILNLRRSATCATKSELGTAQLGYLLVPLSSKHSKYLTSLTQSYISTLNMLAGSDGIRTALLTTLGNDAAREFTNAR